jgi:pilus assembly protein CpaB
VTNKLALVVAIVLGVLSILGIRVYLEKIKSGYELQAQPIPEVVATRDLHQGDVVAKSDITSKDFPRSVIDALGDSRYKNDASAVEGLKVVVGEIKAGQIFQQYHFRRSDRSKRFEVPIGKRALTIPVNVVNGLSGMLRPGDHIDIVTTEEFQMVLPAGLQIPGLKDKIKVTRTLLHKVLILATDAMTDAQAASPDYQTLTLELTSADANRLIFHMDSGAPIHVTKIDDSTGAAGPELMFGDKAYQEVETDMQSYWEGRRALKGNGGR